MIEILFLFFLIAAIIFILVAATASFGTFKKAILWHLSLQQRQLLEQLMTEVAFWQAQTRVYDQERCQVRADCLIDNGGTGATDRLLNSIGVQEEKIRALIKQCRQAKVPRWRINLIA